MKKKKALKLAIQCIQESEKKFKPLANMWRIYNNGFYKHHHNKLANLEEAVSVIESLIQEVDKG